MGKKQYHTRLDDDTAQWVDEFKDEREITQAEALRRLVRAGQQEFQRDDSDDTDEETDGDRQLVTDGGGAVLEPILTQMAGIFWAAMVVLSSLYVLKYLELVELSAFSLVQLWNASIASFVLLMMCAGVLYTRIPEAVDRTLYAGARTLREVSPMRGRQ